MITTDLSVLAEFVYLIAFLGLVMAGLLFLAIWRQRALYGRVPRLESRLAKLEKRLAELENDHGEQSSTVRDERPSV